MPAKLSTWLTRARIGLQIAALKLLSRVAPRVIQTRAFRYLVLRPIVLFVLARLIWRLFRNPEALGVPTDPKAAQMVADIKASLEKRVVSQSAVSEQDLAVNRGLTWGAAGASLILLTTVVLIHTTDRAALIAGACFAVAIPVLIACGFIQATYTITTYLPPTTRDAVGMGCATHGAHFLVFVGLAALLWSYDWKVSVAFIVGSWLAYRYFSRSLMRRVKPSESISFVPSPRDGAQPESTTAALPVLQNHADDRPGDREEPQREHAPGD